jgi:hypothetical protein
MAKVLGGFKVKKAVVRPLFKWVNNIEKYFRMDSAIHQGAELSGQKPAADGTKREPAFLAFVTDMETGEEGQIILGKVLRSTLDEHYPNDAYVGLCFAIEQVRDSKKDYNTYNLSEIEPGETPTTPATLDDAPAKKK